MFPLRILLVLSLFCLPQTAVAQEDTRLVKLHTVTSGETGVTRQFFGHVVAKETVDLAFQVAGQIVEFPVIEGETIARGSLVAGLNLEPFESALDQARLQKDQADRTLERLKKLQGSTVSQTSVDDAITASDLAAIAVRDAERSLRDAKLVAPFDALVATRQVANFSTIAVGAPVARLHNMSDLRIEIDVPEILFQRAGRDPDVSLRAKFPTLDTEIPLEIREFNAETSEIGQTFRITLGMTPPEGLPILPGSSVTVYATIRSDTSHPVIPPSAIVTRNDGSTTVMVFTGGDGDTGSVSAVPVEIQPTLDGKMQVLDGLEDGQEIVASGPAQLADGDSVRRFTGFAN